ncbi:type II secretion system protein [Pontiella sp.]|uniref:type II secretion system protein n=1 Tax=Pontiella sp. TaxID=2837462 RepID=UPI003563C682
MTGRRGFTLLELLVVMLIITVLLGISAAGYSMARQTAKESRARAEIERLRNALEEYRAARGAYPPSAGRSITNVLALLEVYGDLEKLDPWGRQYGYSSTNRYQYKIWSSGFDEADSTDDINPQQTGY